MRVTKDHVKIALVAIVGASTYLSDATGLPHWLTLTVGSIKYASIPILLYLCDVPLFGKNTPASILEDDK